MGNSSISSKSGFFLLLFLLIPINCDPIKKQNPSSNVSSTSEHVKTAFDKHIPSKEETPQLFKESEIKEEDVHENGSEHAHQGVHVVAFKFEYVKAELVVCMFIVLIGLFKLVYHQLKFPRSILPESCCLIALGCCIGVFIRWMAGSKSAEAVSFLEFDSKIFFFFLLPPIILEAAYDLNDKAFVDNFGTIVLYAVVGTVLNIAIIGGLLIFFGFLGVFGTFGIHALDCLLFASLIAAVDPVAVLAIFKEVGVNKMLYFMVFGESLLNDAVTVVCYNLIQDFKGLETIRLYDCFLGFLAFICVSFGGLIIGLIFGILSTLITKFTNHVRVVEPVVCFGMAYLSYVFSELFHFSGIIGIIACGLFQTHYTMGNLSGKSYISINYITKVVSSVSESLIFIILGVMLLNENSFFFDDWHPLFAILSLIFCILARFIVVYFLTYIVNRFTGGVRYISFQEQFIMAYGGLRGAVSFSLAFMIDNKVTTKPTLLAATYLVIMFTVFVQGSTMKSLVKVMNIRLANKDNNFRLFCEFNKGMVNYMTQGIEDVIGNKNQTIFKKLRHLSRHYLRPLLIRGYSEKKTEHKLALVNKTIYPDRNLVDEEAHERRESLNVSKQLMDHKWHMSRIANVKLMEPEVRKRRNFLNSSGPKSRVSINNSLIAMAAPTLGISSHIVQDCTIEECDETENAGTIFKKANATDFWIGASDLVSSGVWTWTDGTPFSYNSWASGEPTLARTGLDMSTPHQSWIGLSTSDKNSNWNWTDGSPVDFYNWAPSQPDHPGKENCVELYSDNSEWSSESKWYERFQNYDCNEQVRAYVCKKPAYTA
ncbi:hypothetical protein FO519_005241 [Halicephalobus sp. NKZ332]|nr:hypothetical protein FO519_005241 [Halicephalobus sp. NKZ332]